MGTPKLHSEVCGKIEIAPAFLHIDILESGHTVKRMDMWAARGDFSYNVYKGLFIKPMVMYGHNNAAKGGIFSAGLQASYYIPFNKKWAISPGVGLGYCHLWTKIDVPDYNLYGLKERFKSLSPFLSLDVYYTFFEGFRVIASYQYSFSRTHTSIQMLGKSRSHSEGPVYGMQLEYDLSPNWSLNLGAAYNISLTKEKHGIRGSGIKGAAVYWF